MQLVSGVVPGWGDVMENWERKIISLLQTSCPSRVCRTWLWPLQTWVSSLRGKLVLMTCEASTERF